MKFENIRIAKVNKVQLVDRFSPSSSQYGTIHITTSHFIFKSDTHLREFWLVNHLISSVERGALTTVGYTLIIRCKHFLTLHFRIGQEKDCQDLYETLLLCSQPCNIEDVFAFSQKDAMNLAEPTSFNWDAEFRRQSVDDKWKLSDFNNGYAHCDTYPESLMVPSNATMQMLIASCRFRSRARLPVLSYWHRATSAAICRCAQPLTGFSARCLEDEQLMDMIAKTNPSTNALYLIDTRPIMNAMVNKVQGKGFEDKRNYNNMDFHSFDIENIHVMRSSLQKLIETCQRVTSVTDYWKGLESCGWLRHIRAVLDSGVFVATSIRKGFSCVVHCSDGWDRTSQTVAIAQLLLDPFYRTIDGFRVLVEKDWLAMGHKFNDRCGQTGVFNEESAKEIAPIFTQFLDVVWQIMRQNVRAFELNERYLIELHDQVYMCQFGTFLGNCDKERKDLQLSTRTGSYWSYINERRDDFINAFYQPNKFDQISVDIRPQSIVLWRSMYNRFDTGILPNESIDNVAIATLDHIGVLEMQLAALQTKIGEIKTTKGIRQMSMTDSGHSSSGGGMANTNCAIATVPTSIGQWEIESGVYDTTSAITTALFDGDDTVVQWQSLRGVTKCSSPNCTTTFYSCDRRYHCYKCGHIYCRQCVQLTNGGDSRICIDCRRHRSTVNE